jgi:hypothetical protein
MNDSICVIRRSRRALLLDVLTATTITGTVALAPLTAACGGGGSPVPPTGPSAATGQALAYARCMRSHGITNFPDPFGNSQQMGFNTTGIDMNSASFKAASTTCQPLMPPDGP